MHVPAIEGKFRAFISSTRRTPETRRQEMQPPRELARETWSEYLAAVSKELLNAPVSIEVIVSPGPPEVEASPLALQRLVYDRRDDLFEIAAARGGPHL